MYELSILALALGASVLSVIYFEDALKHWPK